MHCDLAVFEASADGHKYCLVAAVTTEISKESKLLPIFVHMPKKDAVCTAAALKETLIMCDNLLSSKLKILQWHRKLSRPLKERCVRDG